MEAITTDMNGQPIGIHTVVETDTTVSVPTKIGSVTEVTFRDDGTVLRIAGIRGTTLNTHVTCVDFSEFESVLFNAMSDHKVFMKKDETRELAKTLLDIAKDSEQEPQIDDGLENG